MVGSGRWGLSCMEEKTMNSFGVITIPAHIRKEMGITGMVSLWVGVQVGKNGDKEIVLKKKNNTEEILNKYLNWSKVISRIAESPVSIVCNDRVLAMVSETNTQKYTGKTIDIGSELSESFRRTGEDSVVLKDPSKVRFLKSGLGNVSSYFKIKDTGDDRCYFVIVKGTNYDKKPITKADEMRRYQMISDIVKMI